MSKESVLYLIKTLDALLLLFSGSPEAIAFIEQQRAKATELAEEGRDPTPEEWAALDSEQERLRALLHD